VVSRNPEEMQAHTRSVDFILNTVATPHPSPEVFSLMMKRRSIVAF